MHNPNPFDFVPFADRPFLRTPEEYDALADHWSGYLEVKLKALTPVHIVGYQEPGAKEGSSFMCQQNGRPCIPAASIRGCLRAFLEALTSGWVSQATPEYPKAYRKRHVGFRTFEPYPNRGRKMSRTSPPAVTPDFKPQIRPDKKIDLASYLFGMVIEPESGAQANHEALARKAKIWIEDAFIDNGNLNNHTDWVPDIKHEIQDSFMGGAKPSASNWWYLQPREVWQRRVQNHQIAEFIGEKFWGRKFYYHQDAKRCVKYYNKAEKNWKYDPKRDFYRVWLQCLEQNATTDIFRIYLDNVPHPLAALFVLVLLPGHNIRHKLGYGKSYGYGSIEFTLEAAHLRYDDVKSRLPAPLKDFTPETRDWGAVAWNKAELVKNKLDETLIDWQALYHLAKVLGWQNHEKLLLTYPPFSKGNFAQPITFEQFEEAALNDVKVAGSVKVNSTQARQIAANLFDLKKPIHFRQYQESAKGWNLILERMP